MLDRFVPGLVDHMRRTVPADDLLVGVDEQTAMVGDGERWQVVGRGGVHVRTGDEWTRHRSPDELTVSLSQSSESDAWESTSVMFELTTAWGAR